MTRPSRGILVVDDEPLVASVVCDTLTELGFEVSGAASTGAEALYLAEEHRPNIAVIDIQLRGGMNGVDLARLLGERFGMSVIFLSGSRDRLAITKAYGLRPVRFLKKPFRPTDLLSAIEATGRLADTAGEESLDG
jgi:DNA-binding response OmpR family regulator